LTSKNDGYRLKLVFGYSCLATQVATLTHRIENLLNPTLWAEEIVTRRVLIRNDYHSLSPFQNRTLALLLLVRFSHVYNLANSYGNFLLNSEEIFSHNESLSNFLPSHRF